MAQIQTPGNPTQLPPYFNNTDGLLYEIWQALGGGVGGGGGIPPTALDTFQVQDCGGNNIGTPQIAVKNVVLNKVITRICNTDELAAAIAPRYNTPQIIYLSEGSLTIAANTAHSLSYSLAGGVGALQIGTDASVPLADGEAASFEATTLLNKAFAFSITPPGIVKIVLIKA